MSVALTRKWRLPAIRIVGVATVLVVGVLNLTPTRGSAGGHAIAACAPVPSGLVGWYPGQTSADDFSLTNNDGALQGGATYAAGTVGQAFSLDGANAYVSAPAVSAQDPTTAGSLDAWVLFKQLPSAAQHIMTIIGKGGGGTDFDLQAQQDNKFYFYVAAGNAVLSTTVIQPNTWYFVAGTWDSTGLRIYVNGVLENTNPVSVGRAQSNVELRIGDSQVFGPRRFNGLIDEAEVFNTALSANDVLAIYNAGAEGKCGGPTAVTLSSFGARSTRSGAEVTWRTASEVGIAGFNVWRSVTRGRAYSRVNPVLIRARGTARPSAYAYADRLAPRGTSVFYKLETVGLDGRSTWSRLVRVAR